MVRMERVRTGELRRSAKSARRFFERSTTAKYVLRTLAVFGVTLIMSDGVLTPAQSVLGAIQGINVVAPNIGKSTVVGVSCAILVLLFLAQPFGITKLASCFAPIVIVWLMFNFCFGIYVSRPTSLPESFLYSYFADSNFEHGTYPIPRPIPESLRT